MSDPSNSAAIILQARMDSKRFHGKMMCNLAGIPLIEYVYRRCRLSSIKRVLIATSYESSDNILYNYCKENNITIVRGNLNNVLERYIRTAEMIGALYIVRVCGDTPFVDISLMEELLNLLINEKLDYVSLNRQTCAFGFYSEAVSLSAIKKAYTSTKNSDDLEHVTKFILDNKERFLTKFIDMDLNPDFIKNVRLTIDFPEDIQVANYIIDELLNKYSFTSYDILNTVKRKVLLLK